MVAGVMSVAKSYFDFVSRETNLELVPWDDPEEITVIERQITPEEFERIRQMFEVAP